MSRRELLIAAAPSRRKLLLSVMGILSSVSFPYNYRHNWDQRQKKHHRHHCHHHHLPLHKKTLCKTCPRRHKDDNEQAKYLFRQKEHMQAGEGEGAGSETLEAHMARLAPTVPTRFTVGVSRTNLSHSHGQSGVFRVPDEVNTITCPNTSV